MDKKSKNLATAAFVAFLLGLAVVGLGHTPMSWERAQALRDLRDTLTILAKKRHVHLDTLLYPGGPSFREISNIDDPQKLAVFQRAMEDCARLLLQGTFAIQGGVFRPY